jgi:hypothetical protein
MRLYLHSGLKPVRYPIAVHAIVCEHHLHVLSRRISVNTDCLVALKTLDVS